MHIAYCKVVTAEDDKNAIFLGKCHLDRDKKVADIHIRCGQISKWQRKLLLQLEFVLYRVFLCAPQMSW